MNKPSTRVKSAPAAAKASASLQEPASGFSYSRPFFEELVDRALAHAKKLGATDAGFIAYAKKSPGRFSYGSAGNGSAGHLAFEYLKMTADLFLLHVPYRGTGPMMTDLLSGRLEASAVGAAAMLPFIKSGKVRCIATGSAKRLPQLPDVPTVAEQGFPGFEMTQWYGMLAPANMPAANLEKLSVETMKAVKAPASLERLNADAAEAIGGTPAQFAQFIAAEQERWKKVLLRAKVKPD